MSLSHSKRSTIGAVAAGTVLAWTAPMAEAADVEEFARTTPEVAVAKCADGSQVTIWFEVMGTHHRMYDNDGALDREKRNVRYVGHLERASFEEITFVGTRSITTDYDEQLVSDTGNFRLVTAPGQGVVLHHTGRRVLPLGSFDDADALFSAGPKVREDINDPEISAAVCGLFES